jgi:peptide methionine sulfoxide reductase MsrA
MRWFDTCITFEEVKSRYRRLSKLYHPDVCKEAEAHERFVDIGKQYEEALKRKEEENKLLDDIIEKVKLYHKGWATIKDVEQTILATNNLQYYHFDAIQKELKIENWSSSFKRIYEFR